MKLLLDTHVFLWFIGGDQRLPELWRQNIRDVNNKVYLSVASIWEAIVKDQLGRLPLPQPAAIYLPTQRERHLIASLPIDETHVARLASLPMLHRDPFDRILICQALQDNLTLVTLDTVIRTYPVQTL